MLNSEQLNPNLSSAVFTTASELYFKMFKAVSWAHFSAQANGLLKVLSSLPSISLTQKPMFFFFLNGVLRCHRKRGEHFYLKESQPLLLKRRVSCANSFVNGSLGKKRGIDFGFTTEISSATRDQTKHSQPYLSFGSNSLFWCLQVQGQKGTIFSAELKWPILTIILYSNWFSSCRSFGE